MKMIKHMRFDYKFAFNVPSDDDFSKIKLVQNTVKGSPYKVLYVLDYIPKNDLRDLNGHLMTDGAQETFDSILKFAKVPAHDYLICSFHACRTINKSDAFVHNAFDAFEDRLSEIIKVYSPDKIVVFGLRPFKFLAPKECDRVGANQQSMLGVPVYKTLHGKSTCVTRSLAIDSLFYGSTAHVELVDYIVENIVNAHLGKLRYKINRPEMKVVLIDSMKKFKKFFDYLCIQELVVVDTETDNLYKINNRVLTIQFAFDDETAYIIPLCHKDTPFTHAELSEIFVSLKHFFEDVIVSKGLIYVNAQFDLAIMKTQFNIDFYCSDLIDIFAAELVLGESRKFIMSIEGKPYHSLGNLAVQYGDFSYVDAKIGKSDRKNIGKLDLDDDLLNYMGLDVTVPFSIWALQQRKAADAKYTKYQSMVLNQMSDVIHSLAMLEYNGYPVDIEYLFKLKLPDSPINAEIARLHQEFLSLDSVQAVNKKLLEKAGIKTNALFGKHSVAFKVNKQDHLQELFFKQLGLKPVNSGAFGKSKIDKDFQSEYADIYEVQIFNAYKKAIKLRDSYVNQMLKFWADDDDFKSTKRVRCRFEYLPVITGRISASKPGLQQIPARSSLGKHIKRLFAAERGKMFVKVDYRVNEVRGWGNVAQDAEVAKAFNIGAELIKKYRLKPSEELLKRIGLDGDVHKVNSAYFFAKKIEDVTKDDRNAIKGIIFGLIYGMAVQTLANNLKKDLKYMEDLVRKFMSRFKLGGKWFTDVCNFAKRNFYVESPVGRRRHLFGYVFSEKNYKVYNRITAYCDRRAKNSVVQGVCSDFLFIGLRSFAKSLHAYTKKFGYKPDIKAVVSVHDSVEVETDYAHVLLSINMLEKALTSDVKRIMVERHDFKLLSDLEIDFEFGVTMDNTHSWYGDLQNLEQYIYEGIQYQSVNMKYDYSAKEIRTFMESVFNVDFMSKWMVDQATDCYPRFLEYKWKESPLYKSE